MVQSECVYTEASLAILADSDMLFRMMAPTVAYSTSTSRRIGMACPSLEMPYERCGHLDTLV